MRNIMPPMNTQIIPIKKYLDELHRIGNLSDQKIGQTVGLVRTSIWRLRTGKHTTTTHETVTKIAQLHARTIKRKKKKTG